MSPLHLFTHEYLPRLGGAGSVVDHLAGAAARLGHPVTVWAPAHPDLPGERLGFRIHPLAVRGKQGWPDRRRHRKAVTPFLAELAEGLVHLAEPGALQSWIDLAATGSREPLAAIGITLHGSEILNLASRRKRREGFRALAERAQWIHVLSQYCADLFTENFPGISTPVLVTGGAPTLPAPPPREAAPPGSPFRCLLVGRLHPRKGQLAFVEALQHLPPAIRQRIEVVIVGPAVRTSYTRRVARALKASGVAGTVTGALPPSDLHHAYRTASCFVFPSQPSGNSIEGLGLACLDASLHALPVLASRLGGIPEAVLHGQTGLLFSPNDPDELATCLTRLAKDPTYANQLGANGCHFAASLSWDTIATTLYNTP